MSDEATTMAGGGLLFLLCENEPTKLTSYASR